MAWSPDSKQLAIATGSGNDYAFKIYDVASGKVAKEIELKAQVSLVDWSPDGKTLVVYENAELHSIDVAKGTINKAAPTKQVVGVTTLAYSPDGKWIAAGDADKRIHVYAADTWKQKVVLTGHTHMIDAVAWTPDSKNLVSGADQEIRFWNPFAE
jgi:WD40 repeat protein